MTLLEEFVDASVRLTGFSRIELLGTGAAESYLHALQSAVPSAVVERLLAAFRDLPAGDDDAIATRIVGDPSLGPVAKNVVVLWYCGTWQRLPDEWRSTHGESPNDTTRVISAAAYISGLQWKVIGAHAPGGDMQGFGSWAQAPRGGV